MTVTGSDQGDSAKIKIAHVLSTVFKPIKTFGHFCQFSTNKESLRENQSYILVTVITYWKIRNWHKLFLVYKNYLYKIDFLSFFTRTEEIERSSQLRTRAMREAEKRPSKTYRFTLIRVRFPDGYILQGTCKYTACKSTRFYAF